MAISTREFWPFSAEKRGVKKQDYCCPRCAYPLVPVHARKDKQRRVVALTCPEPYCDHIQVVVNEDDVPSLIRERQAPQIEARRAIS